ncbi:p53-like transcription factor [Neoconidiobolus thromboides FSU 785]|nr:p53-like transcription factor [Neoconidiobolus thromboides FSU 785]
MDMTLINNPSSLVVDTSNYNAMTSSNYQLPPVYYDSMNRQANSNYLYHPSQHNNTAINYTHNASNSSLYSYTDSPSINPNHLGGNIKNLSLPPLSFNNTNTNQHQHYHYQQQYHSALNNINNNNVNSSNPSSNPINTTPTAMANNEGEDDLSGTNSADVVTEDLFFLKYKDLSKLSYIENNPSGIPGVRERTLIPKLSVKIDRGFFMAENKVTCYRRNYFQLTCNLHMFDQDNNEVDLSNNNFNNLVIKNNNISPTPIKAFFIGLTATCESDKQGIDLVQHTTKRDKGPRETPKFKSITPCVSYGSTLLQKSVLFDRLQFKKATANNGRRKNQHHYFNLNLELWAELEDGTLVPITTRHSNSIVVRGRSPGHYLDAGGFYPYKRATAKHVISKSKSKERKISFINHHNSMKVTQDSAADYPSNSVALAPVNMNYDGTVNQAPFYSYYNSQEQYDAYYTTGVITPVPTAFHSALPTAKNSPTDEYNSIDPNLHFDSNLQYQFNHF